IPIPQVLLGKVANNCNDFRAVAVIGSKSLNTTQKAQASHVTSSAANAFKGFARDWIAEVAGDAKMRLAPAFLDPGRDEFDGVISRMERKGCKIIDLGKTFKVPSRREDDRHLAAVGHR